jgi:DNA replication protein DnaC
MQEVMGGEFIGKRENVTLIGTSGTGKTHLACELAFSDCLQGRWVSFSTITGFVTKLLECREDRTLGRLPQQLGRSRSKLV